MFRIGEFSKMTKTTIKALRYYDEIGLLEPEEIDEFTGYRFYSTDQLVKLHQIKALRQVGLSIDEIKRVVSGHDAAIILEKRRSEIISELAERTNQLSQIEFILQRKEEETFMGYAATIKDLPRYTVYTKKMTVPNYDAYFDVIPELGKSVTDEYPDLKCTSPEYCFIVYLNGEYREKDIDIEFCEAVEKAMPDFGEIKFKELDPVTVVSVLHKGPYSTISEAYTFAYSWIKDNGHHAIDNPRESYIDGIWNKENEEEWLTELQIPIAER